MVNSPPKLTLQVDVRPAAQRKHTALDWLDSRHSFSFGRHYDPANTHFGLLLVSSVADAWGVTGDGGTCAWALLDRTKPPWRTGVGDIGADRGA